MLTLGRFGSALGRYQTSARVRVGSSEAFPCSALTITVSGGGSWRDSSTATEVAPANLKKKKKRLFLCAGILNVARVASAIFRT